MDILDEIIELNSALPSKLVDFCQTATNHIESPKVSMVVAGCSLATAAEGMRMTIYALGDLQTIAIYEQLVANSKKAVHHNSREMRNES